jgi:hypothetical protein
MVDLIHEFIYLFHESLVLESAGIKVRLLRGRVEVVAGMLYFNQVNLFHGTLPFVKMHTKSLLYGDLWRFLCEQFNVN